MSPFVRRSRLHSSVSVPTPHRKEWSIAPPINWILLDRGGSMETNMKRLTLISSSMALMAVLAAFITPAVAQHEHEHPAGDPDKLGKVIFPISCEPAVQQQFSSAVAMLHSFWYEKA